MTSSDVPATEAPATEAPVIGDDPATTFDRLAGSRTAIPHQAEMERVFGEYLGDIGASVGREDLRLDLGAHAAARGNTVIFAESSPAPDRVAHEVAHVLQQREAGGVTKGLSIPGDAAEREASDIQVGMRPAGSRYPSGSPRGQQPRFIWSEIRHRHPSAERPTFRPPASDLPVTARRPAAGRAKEAKRRK